MSSRKQADMYRCRIIEADFETGIVTLQMEGKYTVSAGPKLLCDSEAIEQAVLQSLEVQALRDDIADYVHIAAEQATEIQELRKDADRIRFVADDGCNFNTWIQDDYKTKYRLEWDLGAEWQSEWFDTPEDAIDAAIRSSRNE